MWDHNGQGVKFSHTNIEGNFYLKNNYLEKLKSIFETFSDDVDSGFSKT